MGRLGRLNDISTSSKDNKAGCVQLVNATTAFLTYLCCFSIKGLVVLIAVSLAATVSLLTLRDSLQHGGWGIIRDCRLLFSARGNGAFLGTVIIPCTVAFSCTVGFSYSVAFLGTPGTVIIPCTVAFSCTVSVSCTVVCSRKKNS